MTPLENVCFWAGTNFLTYGPNDDEEDADFSEEDSRKRGDPCFHYTVLDQAWRATNITTKLKMCDRNVKWKGSNVHSNDMLLKHSHVDGVAVYMHKTGDITTNIQQSSIIWRLISADVMKINVSPYIGKCLSTFLRHNAEILGENNWESWYSVIILKNGILISEIFESNKANY